MEINKVTNETRMQNATICVLTLENLQEIMNECFQKAKNAIIYDHVQETEEHYLTTQEVSIRMHADRSTLWRWARTGYLVPVKIGKKNLYKESDIIKLGK